MTPNNTSTAKRMRLKTIDKAMSNKTEEKTNGEEWETTVGLV